MSRAQLLLAQQEIAERLCTLDHEEIVRERRASALSFLSGLKVSSWSEGLAYGPDFEVTAKVPPERGTAALVRAAAIWALKRKSGGVAVIITKADRAPFFAEISDLVAWARETTWRVEMGCKLFDSDCLILRDEEESWSRLQGLEIGFLGLDLDVSQAAEQRGRARLRQEGAMVRRIEALPPAPDVSA